MKKHSLLALLALVGAVCSLSVRAGAQIYIEDFKNATTGFDQVWAAPATAVGTGPTTFTSNREIGKLVCTGSESVLAGVVQTNSDNVVPWDRTKQKYVQVMIPNLVFGDRAQFFVFSDANAFAGALLHDQWTEIPGQGPRPQTFDVNAALPATPDIQHILFRFVIINEGYGPAGSAEMNIDWIKAGMSPSAAAAPGKPVFAGPVDGAETNNPPTLTWTAPAGFSGNTYTVTLSQDPLFSDATTQTVLDGVTGTSYTPPAPLKGGKWYWTVSATNSDKMSGEFMEKDLATGGDARNPAAHQFFAFTVKEVPVVLSSFTIE